MLTKLEVGHVESARSGVYVAVLLQNLRLNIFWLGLAGELCLALDQRDQSPV